MVEFIKTQYKIYCSGGKSIGIEKIKQLANAFMTEEQREELFNSETN